MSAVPVAGKREVSVQEIRDFCCCPYMWWFRNEPLELIDRERLQKLRQEPGWGKPRTMPFEVERTGLFWLFSIALAFASGIAWLLAKWLSGPEDMPVLVYALELVGMVTLGFSIYFIVRWLQWRQRTPFYDRQLPGEVLFWEENEPELGVVHATEYGIWGRLNVVLQRVKDVVTMEYRSIETPKRLTEQDRMQAVAQALLAEAEFGVRPTRAYVVYPDRTFEVPVDNDEVKRLLDTVFAMHRAEELGHLPEPSRALHLCLNCPITACKTQAARKPGQTPGAS